MNDQNEKNKTPASPEPDNTPAPDAAAAVPNPPAAPPEPEAPEGTAVTAQPVPAAVTAAAPRPYYISSPAPVVTAPTVPPFQAGIKDGVFALAAFVLGYLFCRWVTSLYGWGTAVFTAAFLGSVTVYLKSRGVTPAPASRFWFAVTLLTGLSFALWSDRGLIGLRTLFLFAAAVYWVLSAAGVLLAGKTGNYLVLDGINGVFIVPFRNFANQYRALGAFRSGREGSGKKALPVLLGLLFALLVLLIVIPQLLRADSGGFSRLLDGITGLFRFDWPRILEFLLYCVPAVPAAAYLFGLVSGAAAKRAADTVKADKTAKIIGALRILPAATAFTVLGAVCVLYILFIACQLPYFFAAFTGGRPDGWLSYSEYARQGFFELCRLSVINLLLLAAANVFSRKKRLESAALKAFNVLLALITLLLIATAFSKMALYIDAFGLTILRILPCVFMIFLAVICASVILLQKLGFSVVRVALAAGAVLFAALCLINADALVVRYNTGRYIAGTLADYDTDILYRAGPAGVGCAVRVYGTASDEALKQSLRTYLLSAGNQLAADAGTYRDTVENALARTALKPLDLG